MEKIKGKCKKCFGCNRLEDENFIGAEECDYYVRDGRNLFALFVVAVYVFSIVISLYGFYVFFNMKVGG